MGTGIVRFAFPRGRPRRRTICRRFRHILEQHRDQSHHVAVLSRGGLAIQRDVGDGEEPLRLRLQVEIKTYNSNEAEKEMDALQAEAQRLFPGAHTSMVGNILQFTVMQQYVSRGQMWSMLLSVLVIGVILVLVFGSWKVGLVGMIPNLAPAVIVGSMMGWLDYPLDMMTASLIPMILGIAVDDTIHFINHSHVEYNRCGSYADAIKGTFRTEGLAIVMSTVIVSATFAGFMSSNATQMVNWGILAVAGMVSALLADLFLTPILIKYLRVFSKEKRQIHNKKQYQMKQ